MPDTHPYRDAAAKLELDLILQKIAAGARTVYGREAVAALEPSPIPAEVYDELERVREYRALLDADDPPPLAEIEDCRAALHRAGIPGSSIPSQDLRQILQALTAFRELNIFQTRRAERAPMLAALAAQLVVDKVLEFHIDRVVDEEGGVKDTASKELRQLRRDIIDKTGQLRRRMEVILKRVSEDELVQEELVTLRDGRMVLPVKLEHKRQVQGFIHSTSATGQTVYIEPTETLDLNNEIRDLQFAEQREVAKILTELTDRLRPQSSPMLDALVIFGQLDAINARARYAIAVQASFPSVSPGGPLVVSRGRHPILMLHKKHDAVVPLDLELGHEATTLLITGPNAGGKSVAMKAVGLFALMVQCGIPVPCDETSAFPVYSGVYVDIGDEQSVENDLSTFSSHVRRLAAITAAADARSLVLIDEIGTGTDPAEGSALGAAILEALTARGAHVIATTHHGMLKAFAHEHPRMVNGAMEFDMQSLEPTYRFHAGLPGSSYAFEITRRHGMEPRIIERARELLGTRGDALEHLLGAVEKKSQELHEHLRAARSAEQKYEALLTEYQDKVASLKAEARRVKQAALEEAETLLEDANAAIESAVRDIRESQAEKETVRQARERVATFRERVAAEKPAPDPQQKQEKSAAPQRAGVIQMGDTVAMRDNPSSRGTVLDRPKDGYATVAFGMMKMRVELRSLVAVEEKKGGERVATAMPESRPRNEIDLRGQYGDDAVRALDTYLYEAYSAGFKRVDIIHGKGTGALRKRVHDYLKDLPFVADYRLGEWNEGSTGVTVVFLKD
ncbi:MAG: endonuclease MutS2 [Ignavibacteriae bacterium]|nr:endonuclease MutS2 [Ignavibacteriota bacterium]